MYIRNYLNSVLRHKFLIMDTYHLDTLYVREQGCEESWLFFEAKRGPRAKTFGKQWPIRHKSTAIKSHDSISP